MAAKTIDELAGNCDLLLKHTEGFQLPITRNVAQISEKSLQLAQGPAVVDPNRAQSLLRAGGVEMSQIHKDISASMMETDTTTSYPGLQLNANDVEGYLSLERDRTIIGAISETRLETLQKTRSQFQTTLQSEWESTKRELLSHIGIQFPGSLISTSIPTPYNNAASSSISQTSYSTQASSLARTVLDAHTASYAHIVINMVGKNQTSPSSAIPTPHIPTPQIPSNFAQEFEIHSKSQQDLHDVWKLLSAVVGKVTKTANSHTSSLHSSKATHDVIRQARKSGDLANTALLLEGSLDFLHSQYANLIENEIVRQPVLAKHGGLPSEESAIRGYLNIIFSRADTKLPSALTLDGMNAWAFLFYMIRCGWMGPALKFVEKHHDKFGAVFSRFFSEYCMNKRRLSLQSWDSCCKEYNSSVRPAFDKEKDPYKLAVWNLVAKAEVNELRHFRAVVTSAQDFVWYKLMLVSMEPVPEKMRASDLQLRQLQQQLFDLGPSHFNPAGRSPFIYLFVLLSVQLFEQGISFLFSATPFQVEAIHMAIVLDYYGLLHVPTLTPPDIPVELLSTQNGLVTFNIVRIIRDYASRLVATNPYEALTYCALLERDPKTLVTCVSDLVFASSELELYLGSVSDDKNKQTGMVSTVFPQHQQAIRQAVAARCQAQGKVEEAIQLYELSMDYDAALQLLIRQLSKLLAARVPDRQRIVRLASDMYRRLNPSQFTGLQTPLIVAFDQLLQLDTFFELVGSMKFVDALQHMANLHLIPFNPSQIQTCTATFHRLHETVKRLFPEILSTTMQVLTHQHTLLSHTPQTPFDTGRAERDQNIRTAAKAIVTFSGTIQYQIPKDLTAQLLSSELIIRS